MFNKQTGFISLDLEVPGVKVRPLKQLQVLTEDFHTHYNAQLDALLQTLGEMKQQASKTKFHVLDGRSTIGVPLQSEHEYVEEWIRVVEGIRHAVHTGDSKDVLFLKERKTFRPQQPHDPSNGASLRRDENEYKPIYEGQEAVSSKRLEIFGSVMLKENWLYTPHYEGIQAIIAKGFKQEILAPLATYLEAPQAEKRFEKFSPFKWGNLQDNDALLIKFYAQLSGLVEQWDKTECFDHMIQAAESEVAANHMATVAQEDLAREEARGKFQDTVTAVQGTSSTTLVGTEEAYSR